MRFLIRGKKWLIKFTKLASDFGHVDWKRKTIRIAINHKEHINSGDQELDTIIHEVLHVCLPDFKEDSIIEVANGLSDVLWKLGYRKQNNGEKDS